jgi:hypothetical protein
MKTRNALALVVSIAACTANNQTLPDSGKVICANTGECIHADFYAACSANGSVMPVQLDGGVLAPEPITAPQPDGGRIVPAGPISLLFTNDTTLWLLDGINNQIDVLNVAVWPPEVTGSIATGAAPNQLVACDGMILSINSLDNTVQGIDPTSMQTLKEVNVGMGENPYFGVCDGQHTLYVSDSVGGNVKAIDLSTFQVLNTFPIPEQAIVADPDGGPVSANPEGVAFFPSDAGGTVFVTVASLNASNNPTGPGSVVATDGLLLQQLAIISNGPSCVNPGFLASSQDGTQIFESCGGNFSVDGGPSEIARIRPADLSSASPFSVPLYHPYLLAVLKNGMVAVTDSTVPQVAVFNPADGTIEGVYSPCADAGHKYNNISGLVAAP